MGFSRVGTHGVGMGQGLVKLGKLGVLVYPVPVPELTTGGTNGDGWSSRDWGDRQ